LKIKLCRKIGFVESSLMIGGHVLALFLTTHPTTIPRFSIPVYTQHRGPSTQPIAHSWHHVQQSGNSNSAPRDLLATPIR
jgi:hypothetical protein